MTVAILHKHFHDTPSEIVGVYSNLEEAFDDHPEGRSAFSVVESDSVHGNMMSSTQMLFSTQLKENSWYTVEVRGVEGIPKARAQAFEAVNSEREYQDELFGGTMSSGRKGKGERTIDEWILYIYGYALEMVGAGATVVDPDKKLAFMRKIGGMAVHCMEQHGAPKRDVYLDAAVRLAKDIWPTECPMVSRLDLPGVQFSVGNTIGPPKALHFMNRVGHREWQYQESSDSEIVTFVPEEIIQ